MENQNLKNPLHKKILCSFLSLLMLASILIVSTSGAHASYYEYRGSKTIEVGRYSYSNHSEGGSAPYTWRTSNSSVVQLRVDKTNSNYCDFLGVSPGTATVTLYSYKLVTDWSGSHIEPMTERWNVTVVARSSVKKANKLAVSTKNKTVKAKKLKRANVTVKAITVKKANGAVKFSKLASSSKRLTVNSKTGKITVKKGTKKGTYKIKVKISAKGTKKYKAKSVTKTIKIKVK